MSLKPAFKIRTALNEFIHLPNHHKNVHSPYPLVESLVTNGNYEKYGSGDYDSYGKLLKPFANIEPERLLKITSFEPNKFQIDYVDEKLPPEVIGLFMDLDCDFNFFKTLGICFQ